MPRRARVFVEGLTYHVYNRVGRGEAAHMRHAIDRLNTYLAPFIGKMLSYGLNLVPSTRWPSVQIAGGVVTARTWFDSAPEAIPDSPHTDPSHLLRIAGYSPRPLSCTATDHNTRFTLSSGVDVPAALFSHTRAAWALFKYTTQVNPCRCGGGNHLFMETWTGYGFDQ
jgi:hypothetical protein